MCRIWMDTVCGREMKDGIRYLAFIGMAILVVRIILILFVSTVYYIGYAGFILIDLFAILAFYLIYENIECERDMFLLFGITIHVVVIFFFTFFCLIMVVWMVEFPMDFLHFLLSLLLCSLSMIFLVLDIYFVLACATDYCKRASRGTTSPRQSLPRNESQSSTKNQPQTI